MSTTSIVILAAGTAIIVGGTVIWYRRHSLRNASTPSTYHISPPSPPIPRAMFLRPTAGGDLPR